MSAWILAALVGALILDRIVGDPPALWARLPHPVVLFGHGISFFDKRLNREGASATTRRRNGVASIILLLALSAVIGRVLSDLFRALGPFGFLLEMLLVAVFLAQKSLGDHVSAVAIGLRQEGLAGGRRAVSMIVGRDPQALDEPAVCRAAIESLAENFADGVVAPALWYVLAGLPGLLAYKMLNTADSMIGHKNERYRDFGWAAARLDDLANWPAARLSSLLIATATLFRLGGRAARRSVSVTLRDSGLHRSPNSGWPEAAFAGALDIQLTGPRIYGGERVSEPMINGSGRSVASVGDIETGVALFYASCAVLTVLTVALLGLEQIF
ncbi:MULTISPECIES: adenosylcobinamide-phosphate synthase CbiB [Alphaproteobacteria]|uniref:Cobalamin biosynthesis protein CobD n=2 Tax=Alphaproteobacteria TaxID=28211 RepID=A0A512HI09_9HYPH|nr:MULTISPECIES: adenosylcobinamide-phosphate synthase CbiB [Alphaproteobacteria]GEO85020.1 cobalamin biosynthesis protein CobD [Ciceribacter naphthalenivorans]GLR22954.1 cobalamin biosynthesis protein CobD [Ciceribacter naphthalenivorans]GLT05810.1 cobalamin biosynthesis protein CobD [Sphingomonas psychrolutea]